MSKSAARVLREMLAGPDIVQAPGAYDGATAHLIQQAGFKAVYMTGAGTSATYGFPDYGLVTLNEMVDNAWRIVRSVDLPLICDADTGYGNELNVTRTIREFEARGVAGLHIEDQVSPKRCGHLEGKELVTREEFASKIRAAAEARRDPDFLIIARTDAISVAGFEEAIARGNLALKAGADMVFVESPRTLEEVAEVPKQINGPCLLNVVQGGKTPIIGVKDVQSLGFRIAIYPGLCLKAAIPAIDEALAGLRDTGRPAEPKGGTVTPMDTFRRWGADAWDALRRRHEKDAAAAE